MENYKKAVIRELDTNLPLPEFLKGEKDPKPNSVTISVKTGTKMRNVLSFGFKQLAKPEIKHIVWMAEAEAIGKAVSCAEIMKRGQVIGDDEPQQQQQPTKSSAKRKSVSANNSVVEQQQKRESPPLIVLYQTNVLGYRRTEEIWEPVVQGLDKLKVNKDVPILAIILSKDVPQLKDIASQGQAVSAIQRCENCSFETFWQSRINAVLANVPASGGSAPVDIKPGQQSKQPGGASGTGRTPPLS